MSTSKPHIIVFANEKGGTGKSTTAVHASVALAASGARVAAIDLDTRQRTLTRYLDNRAATARRLKIDLPGPRHVVLGLMTDAGLAHEIGRLGAGSDFIVIDTPGRDDPISRAAITRADTIVTPINDSFIDLDLIGQVDPDTFRVKRLSFYAELIWGLRKNRAKGEGASIDWVVLRNRMQNLDARNMRRVGAALGELSKRVGFRTIPGLRERVVYRELFPQGLTLIDVEQIGSIGVSHIAARQELREMVAGFALPVRASDQSELALA